MGAIRIGVDASRNRSGGARAYLVGIFNSGDPRCHGVSEVHLWAPAELLDAVEDRAWLVKHYTADLEQSLARQLWWQATQLKKELTKLGCDLLFSTDASTLCRFSPMVTLSQDMLSYEPGVMRYFGFSKARLRLLAILLIQNRAFRWSEGVIFLTKYASKTIQSSCGRLNKVAIIPHGVGDEFLRTKAVSTWPTSNNQPIKCLYVSNAEMYKHQWVVVASIAELRRRGHNINIKFVGGGAGPAMRLLINECERLDPSRQFVELVEFLPQSELPHIISVADIFIFASSCENMPITLLEAMAVGVPIACSDRGPMPEVLKNGGVYFDPMSTSSITTALEQIILDENLRGELASRAKTVAAEYSWIRCATETWGFLMQIVAQHR